MNRGVITISENGTVSMPTDTVWMTMQEMPDMYNGPKPSTNVTVSKSSLGCWMS